MNNINSIKTLETLKHTAENLRTNANNNLINNLKQNIENASKIFQHIEAKTNTKPMTIQQQVLLTISKEKPNEKRLNKLYGRLQTINALKILTAQKLINQPPYNEKTYRHSTTNKGFKKVRELKELQND